MKKDKIYKVIQDNFENGYEIVDTLENEPEGNRIGYWDDSNDTFFTFTLFDNDSIYIRAVADDRFINGMKDVNLIQYKEILEHAIEDYKKRVNKELELVNKFLEYK